MFSSWQYVCRTSFAKTMSAYRTGHLSEKPYPTYAMMYSSADLVSMMLRFQHAHLSHPASECGNATETSAHLSSPGRTSAALFETNGTSPQSFRARILRM